MRRGQIYYYGCNDSELPVKLPELWRREKAALENTLCQPTFAVCYAWEWEWECT